MLDFEDGILVNMSKMDKLFRKKCFACVAEYAFSPCEILVLMFLSNEKNAPMDTARDISYYRNISKSLVAKSVDSLCQKGFLVQHRDSKDRRQVHLCLTEKSAPISGRLNECRRSFIRSMEAGIAPEEKQVLLRVSRQIEANLNSMIKGNDCK